MIKFYEHHESAVIWETYDMVVPPSSGDYVYIPTTDMIHPVTGALYMEECVGVYVGRGKLPGEGSMNPRHFTLTTKQIDDAVERIVEHLRAETALSHHELKESASFEPDGLLQAALETALYRDEIEFDERGYRVSEGE